MAFNKAQTSLVTKIIFIVFGVILIVGLAGPAMTGFLGLIGSPTGTPMTTRTGPDAAGTGATGQGVLDRIAADYQPTVDALGGQLTSDPTSASVLVGLGSTYFDWAQEIQRTEGVTPNADRPYWAFAASYYDRAVEAGFDTPEVRTDDAVARFYSGNTAGAIEMARTALGMSPGFPTALYNLGIFYESAGETRLALDSYRAYVEADPGGAAGDPQAAQARITELESALGGATGADGPSE